MKNSWNIRLLRFYSPRGCGREGPELIQTANFQCEIEIRRPPLRFLPPRYIYNSEGMRHEADNASCKNQFLIDSQYSICNLASAEGVVMVFNEVASREFASTRT